MASLLSARTQEAIELRTHCEDAKGALKMTQEMLNEKNEQLKVYEGSVKGNTVSVTRLEKEKHHLEEMLTTINAELSAVRKEKFQISLQYEEVVNGDLRTLKTDCESLSNTVESMTVELTGLRSKNMHVEAEMARQQDELETERTRAKRAQQHSDELDRKYAETSTELTKAMSSIIQLQGMVRYFQQQEEDHSDVAPLTSSSALPSHPSSPESESGNAKADGPLSPSVRSKSAELNSLRRQLQEERILAERLQSDLNTLQREEAALKQQNMISSSRLQAIEAEYKNSQEVIICCSAYMQDSNLQYFCSC